MGSLKKINLVNSGVYLQLLTIMMLPITIALSEADEIKSQVLLRTCCNLNLQSETSTDCQKRSHEDDVVEPSKSFSLPPHLTAENVTTIFKILTSRIPCRPSVHTRVYLPLLPSENGNRNVLILRNGYLKVHKQFYPPEEFCISSKNETSLEISVCPMVCGKKGRACVPKCCGLDKVYSIGLTPGSKRGCANADEYWSPRLHSTFLEEVAEAGQRDPYFIERYPSAFKYQCFKNKTLFYAQPRISETIKNFINISFSAFPFQITADGNLIYQKIDGSCEVMKTSDIPICVDGVQDFGPKSEPFKNQLDQLVVFLCAKNNDDEKTYGVDKSWIHGTYATLMFISSVFLLLTITVYGLLWQRQKVHGWTVVSHTVSLFFLYIVLASGHVIGIVNPHFGLNSFGCKLLGILTHYFFLATFCWLFLFSFDLWMTFRTVRARSSSKGVRRYFKYSVFGWGLPLLFVATGIILDTKYLATLTCHQKLIPAYGAESCNLQKKALGVFLYYPIGLMIIGVLLLFAITTYRLFVYRESTKMATKDDKREQFYRLFMKLFVVMGILWIFEIISWFSNGTDLYWYWIIFDLLNILRAVAVFVIFVCKPDIIEALRKNYPKLQTLLKPCSVLVPERNATSSMKTASTMDPESVELRPSESKSGSANLLGSTSRK